jgi:translation initiation factor 4E
MVEAHGDEVTGTKNNEEEKSNIIDVRHHLEHKWTLWFFRTDRTKKWEDCQTEVASFNTVEDFWALYNHVENAAKLPVGCDYR